MQSLRPPDESQCVRSDVTPGLPVQDPHRMEGKSPVPMKNCVLNILCGRHAM